MILGIFCMFAAMILAIELCDSYHDFLDRFSRSDYNS